jgi:hypothetical protein
MLSNHFYIPLRAIALVVWIDLDNIKMFGKFD